MPITEILVRNAEMFGPEVCLTEINMDLQESHHVSWLEYELIENNPAGEYRREMTWLVFDEKANRMANLLLKRGIKKGDKVAILLMNCLEWLPIYFGIIKAGAVAVPLNFRYTAEEIKYCLELSESIALIFGPEFVERVETIYRQMPQVKLLLFAGENRPSFAESYDRLTANCCSEDPKVRLTDEDDAVIYFSSGTTGFPKAILHIHQSLMSACCTEVIHHGQKRDDNFFVYSAALPYWSQNALVWQFVVGKQGRIAAWCKT
jgi:Acyl-CoA synthetases (AMP-forming)/AMP-acid ligases II